jgi:hypothetical protein
MTIKELINQCEIRLNYLKNYRKTNIELGNTELVNTLDIEILQTQETLETLKTI